MQIPPPDPQAEALGVTQFPFWQQPFGQVLALQVDWQVPLVQVNPARQAPQVAPLIPQALTLGVVQTPFWQQPFGHVLGPHVVVPVQAPLVQTAPTGHSKQVAPSIPQAEVLGVVQTEFLQQPLGQLLELQFGFTQVIVFGLPERFVLVSAYFT